MEQGPVHMSKLIPYKAVTSSLTQILWKENRNKGEKRKIFKTAVNPQKWSSREWWNKTFFRKFYLKKGLRRLVLALGAHQKEDYGTICVCRQFESSSNLCFADGLVLLIPSKFFFFFLFLYDFWPTLEKCWLLDHCDMQFFNRGSRSPCSSPSYLVIRFCSSPPYLVIRSVCKLVKNFKFYFIHL